MDNNRVEIAYKNLFDSENGKIVLDDLAQTCGQNGVRIPDNALTLAFREGKRSVYVYIKGLIDIDVKELQSKGE